MANIEKANEKPWLIMRKDTEAINYLPLITDYIQKVLSISDENIKPLNFIKARLYNFRFFLLNTKHLYDECWLSASEKTLNPRRYRLRQYVLNQCAPYLEYIKQLITQITITDQHPQFTEQVNDLVAYAQIILAQITGDADSIEI